MTEKTRKQSVIFLTITSAFLFLALIVVISLSPLADLGPNANQFGSVGMWSAIAMLLALYFIPLITYAVGMDQMKFLMALFCIIGLFIPIPIILLLLIFFTGKFTYTIVIIATLSIVMILINILWLFVAFMPIKKDN